MPTNQLPYRIVDGAALIEVRLDTVHQLFNTLDPSPFSTRDLDANAEEYLVSALDDLHGNQQARLRFVIPGAGQEVAGQLEAAVHHYFDYRRWAMDRRIRVLFREGRLALVIGVAFLIACLSVSRLVLSLDWGIASEILSEGLFICGWVAMWRPLEIVLFDWWPLAKRKRVFANLAAIPVEVIEPDSEPGAHASA